MTANRTPPWMQKPRVQAMDIAGRTPPHNLDIETAVLSAELLDSKVVDEVIAILPNGEPFYSDAHRRIHDAVCELHSTHETIDIQTVANLLRRKDHVQAIGGIAYLVKIVDATPSVANVAAHAQAVRQLWRVRRMIEASQLTAAEGYTDYGDPEAFMGRAVESVSNVADDKINMRDATQMYDVMQSTIESYTSVAARGVPTGFVDVDAETGGLRRGELVILAARPGVGKTSYAMNVVENVASQPPPESPDHAPTCGVMVFSLEMPTEQLGQRMACSRAQVDLKAFRSQKLTDDGYNSLVREAQYLATLPVWIDDTAGITLLELRAKVRKRQHAFDKRWPDSQAWKQRIGLIVIDYLQLMQHHGVKEREQEVSAISRGLKAMAKDLDVPVIALSQLNRNVESRSGAKRPQLSDLRESGAIEQDADMVQFLYRPEMAMTPDELETDKGRKWKGYAENIIAKQRNGPTGIVKLTFVDRFTRFHSRARDEWQGDDAE